MDLNNLLENYQVPVQVEKIEGENCILKTNKGKTITWPRENLPPSVSPGDKLNIIIQIEGNRGPEREEMARKLLNEILKKE